MTFDPAARWAAPGDEPLVGDELRALLAQAFAIGEAELASGSPAAVALDVGASALGDAARPSALAAAVGAEHVVVDDAGRAAHANGMSYLDLVRRTRRAAARARRGRAARRPTTRSARSLRACSEHGVAVVPFGGGTSVVGGVAPERGGFAAVVALDLRAARRSSSRWTTCLGPRRCRPALTGPRAEELLAARGFTLGHVPQSFERATIGGYAATRSAGQLSTGWGRFDALVERVRVATPAGDLDLGRAPGSAAGPDLRAARPRLARARSAS